MSNPTGRNLTIYQGTDFTQEFIINNQQGLPVDPTGFTFSGDVKAVVGGSVILSFTFTVLNQTSVPGGMSISLLPAATSGLAITKPTTYIYDVKMDDGSEVSRILQGSVVVIPQVSI